MKNAPMKSSSPPKKRMNTRPLSQADLRNRLSYDASTGDFIWNENGKIAGNLKPSGYITIQINKSVYYAHRLAWLYMTGSLPIMAIDHVNREKSDNRFENLRVVTDTENQLNRTNKNGVLRTGVTSSICWNPKRERWQAYLKRDNKMVFNKRFREREDAERSLAEARIKFPPTDHPIFHTEKRRQSLA